MATTTTTTTTTTKKKNGLLIFRAAKDDRERHDPDGPAGPLLEKALARSKREGEGIRPVAGAMSPGSPAVPGGRTTYRDGVAVDEMTASDAARSAAKKKKKAPSRLSAFAKATRKRGDGGENIEDDLRAAKK